MKNFILTFTLILVSASSLFAQKGLSIGINAGVNLSLNYMEYGNATLPQEFRKRQTPGINQALYLEYGFNDRIGLRLSVKRATLTNAFILDDVVTDTLETGRRWRVQSSAFSSTRSPIHFALSLRQQYQLSKSFFLTSGIGIGYMYVKKLGSTPWAKDLRDMQGNVIMSYRTINYEFRRHNTTINGMVGLEYKTKLGNAFTFDIGFNAGMNAINELTTNVSHKDKT